MTRTSRGPGPPTRKAAGRDARCPTTGGQLPPISVTSPISRNPRSLLLPSPSPVPPLAHPPLLPAPLDVTLAVTRRQQLVQLDQLARHHYAVEPRLPLQVPHPVTDRRPHLHLQRRRQDDVHAATGRNSDS